MANIHIRLSCDINEEQAEYLRLSVLNDIQDGDTVLVYLPHEGIIRASWVNVCVALTSLLAHFPLETLNKQIVIHGMGTWEKQAWERGIEYHKGRLARG